jgi:hypothetical protein
MAMKLTLQLQLTKDEARLLDEAVRLYVENRVVNDDGTDAAQAEVVGAKVIAATVQDAIQAARRHEVEIDIPHCDECGADLSPLAHAINADHLPHCSLYPRNVFERSRA